MKRRLILSLMVLGVLIGTAAPAIADENGQEKGSRKGMPGLTLRWKATSPAIHEGDQYNLLVTNKGDEAQKARIVTEIMDHRNHANVNVIDEPVELEPGEEREFTATNDYGDANHFNTLIGSETEDLDLSVTLTDAAGNETAWFNQAAFLTEVKGRGAKGKEAKVDKHAHDGGFAALVETGRMMPLSLGVFAVAGAGLYAVRRRWAWTGPASGLIITPPVVWKIAAVGGLVLSAALHIGLAPMHFEEAAVQGVFFLVASVVAAIIAAAILVWPSRPAYLAGVVLSLALILLWAVFLLVAPPGAEAAEAVDLVGLFTKATELMAATACTVLWSRDRRPGRTLE